jgi:uncharacterized iron-regulated membrane protein
LPSATLRRYRGLWLKLHRYLGLLLGAILVIAGISGSLLVFWQPLDAWLEPSLPAPSAECTRERYQAVPMLLDAAARRAPRAGRLSSIAFPHAEQPLLWLQYSLPKPGADWDDRFDVFVDPCTGAASAARVWDTQHAPWRGPVMGVVMRLHTSLLLNRPGLWAGNYILSTSALLLIVSVLSGVYLWWPRRARWGDAIRIKRGASRERFIYDLHKSVGACAALLLLISLFSGMHLYEPWHGLINRAVQRVSPSTRYGAAEPEPTRAETQIAPVEIVARVYNAFPDALVRSLSLPDAPGRAYSASLYTGAVWPTTVRIDGYTGKILSVLGPHEASRGDRFLSWLYPLHTGHAFGLPGRIVILLLGLLPGMLYVTGIMRWLQKRRARDKERSRRQQTPSDVLVHGTDSR